MTDYLSILMADFEFLGSGVEDTGCLLSNSTRDPNSIKVPFPL